MVYANKVLTNSSVKYFTKFNPQSTIFYTLCPAYLSTQNAAHIQGLLEKYPTFGREKETGLLGALDT
jgi:hypothetical protein